MSFAGIGETNFRIEAEDTRIRLKFQADTTSFNVGRDVVELVDKTVFWLSEYVFYYHIGGTFKHSLLTNCGVQDTRSTGYKELERRKYPYATHEAEDFNAGNIAYRQIETFKLYFPQKYSRMAIVGKFRLKASNECVYVLNTVSFN